MNPFFWVYKIPNLKPTDQFLDDIYSLNEKQYNVLLNIMKHYDNEQSLNFISVYAGVGKSRLIECI